MKRDYGFSVLGSLFYYVSVGILTSLVVGQRDDDQSTQRKVRSGLPLPPEVNTPGVTVSRLAQVPSRLVVVSIRRSDPRGTYKTLDHSHVVLERRPTDPHLGPKE